MKKWMIALGVAAVLVSATGSTSLATTAEHVKIEKVKSFEEKVDVGGYSLYVNSQGKDKPVVVFDTGYGDNSEVWETIQSGTNGFAQSVRYDRAGLGNSDATTTPRTALQKAVELHTMLQNAKIKGPYIMVGHSLGGVTLRMFADLYPNEVAGLVMVDSSHEDQNELILEQLPPEFHDLYLGQFTSPDGNYQEVQASMDQLRAARPHDALRHIPMTVLSSQNHQAPVPNFETLWLGLQQDIASLSDESEWIVSETASHYIQLDDPQLVIDSIEDMVERVEKKNDKNK